MSGLRVRLLRDLVELDMRAGSLGTIVKEKPGDDREYAVQFDSRPSLAIWFTEPELDARTPQHVLELVGATA